MDSCLGIGGVAEVYRDRESGRYFEVMMNKVNIKYGAQGINDFCE